MVLPSFDEMLSAPTVAGGPHEGIPRRALVDVSSRAFRPVLLDDLLGRGVVETESDAIREYLRGRVVLVTGAGGSIGSQLCREIAAFSPGRLVMTDRDDSLLHGVQLSVDGRGLLDSQDLVLGDLRTPTFVRSLVAACRPDVVFHAAAVKHLTLAERFPAETFLTNVAATAELFDACVSAGVERFVNISTDKAADPTSVLGYSKRVTERLTATYGDIAPESSRYISVRFGNVLGSRGSALTTFAAQLATGQPLTITSPDMERYFMTVHEAAQLVLQGAVHGRTGEGLVLDMGEPHNIEQLSRRFAALQGFRSPAIVYTGARPGEKAAERLFAHDEPDTPAVPPAHQPRGRSRLHARGPRRDRPSACRAAGREGGERLPAAVDVDGGRAGSAHAVTSCPVRVAWLAAAAAGTSVLVVWASLGPLTRHGVIDIPADRSLHVIPTPRGGGLGILAAVLLVAPASMLAGTSALHIRYGWLFAGLPAVCILGMLGLVDDLFTLTATKRLLIQLVVGGGWGLAAVLLSGSAWVWIPATILLVVGVVNVTNFMDGANGLVTLHAAVASAWYLLVGLAEGQPGVVLLAAAVLGGPIGFLPFNAPVARVFLGDVGSYTLGAVWAVQASWLLLTGTSPVVATAPLFVLVTDAVVTMVAQGSQGGALHGGPPSARVPARGGCWLVHTRHIALVVAAVAAATCLLALPVLFVERSRWLEAGLARGHAARLVRLPRPHGARRRTRPVGLPAECRARR